MNNEIRIIQYNRERADNALSAYSALVSLEAIRPELKHNPAWTVLRQDAYENFCLAFEEVGQ